MNPEGLAQNIDNPSDIVYLIDDDVFDARSMMARFDDQSSFQLLDVNLDDAYRPLFVRTQNGWIVFETYSPHGRIEIVGQDASEDDPFIEVIPIQTLYPYQDDQYEINMEVYEKIVHHTNNQLSLSDLLNNGTDDDTALPQFDYSGPTYRRPRHSPLLNRPRSSMILPPRFASPYQDPLNLPDDSLSSDSSNSTNQSLTHLSNRLSDPSSSDSRSLNRSNRYFPYRSHGSYIPRLNPIRYPGSNSPNMEYGRPGNLSNDRAGNLLDSSVGNLLDSSVGNLFDSRVGNLFENKSDNRMDNFQLFELSYLTLIKRLYGLSVQMPVRLPVYGVSGLMASVVDYSEIENKLTQQQIEKFSFDEIYQPWAGPPSTKNHMLTFVGFDGRVYLSKVRYDPVNNSIFPPES